MISVVIPAYNRADLIGQTLRSLLNQTMPADEIIVVDDGSTDGTQEAAWAEFHRWESEKVKGINSPEFKVIRQENAGPAAARNRGFLTSKGQYIHFFDSDDIAAPNKHAIQVRALRETGADIAIGPWQKGFFDGSTFRPFHHVLQQRGLPDGSLLKSLLTDWSLVPHCCLFTRQIVELACGFPEDCFGTEDTFFFLTCFLANAKCVHTPGTLELYRIGNVKITDAAEGGQRHLTEWSHVLLKMRAACSARGFDPAQWFGFRMRCWAALRDLKRYGLADSAVLQGLREASQGTPHLVYTGTSLLRRLGGGLKQRIVADRACPSFRTGPLTTAQIALIREAGYQVAW
jgi:glycosyltransferase involved in cell wall biosynthesis